MNRREFVVSATALAVGGVSRATPAKGGFVPEPLRAIDLFRRIEFAPGDQMCVPGENGDLVLLTTCRDHGDPRLEEDAETLLLCCAGYDWKGDPYSEHENVCAEPKIRQLGAVAVRIAGRTIYVGPDARCVMAIQNGRVGLCVTRNKYVYSERV